MYCSSYGAAAKPGLNFCKNCGEELNTKDGSAKDSGVSRTLTASQESLIWAIVAVTIAGLGVLIGLMAVMKNVVHFNDGLIAAFSLLTFLTILATDSVFIWLLVRSALGGKKTATRKAPPLTRRDLDELRARLLSEPAVSITEHTTRDLEPALRERTHQ